MSNHVPRLKPESLSRCSSSSTIPSLFCNASTSLDTSPKSIFPCPDSKISRKIQPPWKCSLCFSREHQVYHCSQFHDKNQLLRAIHISTAKLCVNYLGCKHTSSSCRSLNRCRWCDCNQFHHTLVHHYARRYKNTLLRFPNK